MTHDIPHDLEPDLASWSPAKRVEAYADRFSEFDFRSRWLDDENVEIGFSVAGKSLDGKLSVGLTA